RRRIPGVQDEVLEWLRKHGMEGRRRRCGFPGWWSGETAEGRLRAAGICVRRVDAHVRSVRGARRDRPRPGAAQEGDELAGTIRGAVLVRGHRLLRIRAR